MMSPEDPIVKAERQVAIRRRITYIIIAFFTAVAVASMVMTVILAQQTNNKLHAAEKSKQAAQDQRDVAIAGLQQACDQINASGGQCSIKPEQIIKGEAGAPGLPGPQGPPGKDGQPGPPGATGAAGPAGINGKDGVNGTNGADGAVGPPGPAGQDGKDGVNGKDGSPATSMTFTAPDGKQYICNRVDGSSDTSPSYTCSAVQGAQS